MMQDDVWRAERLASLLAPDGWLNLTDRVEIAPGPQRVGRAGDNDLILSAGPDHLGVLELVGAGALFATPDGQMRAFAATSGFPQLSVPPLLLELHTVDGIAALRVRDTSITPRLSLRYFDYDPEWRIMADWQSLPQAENRTIAQKGAGDTVVTCRTGRSSGGTAPDMCCCQPTGRAASRCS